MASEAMGLGGSPEVSLGDVEEQIEAQIEAEAFMAESFEAEGINQTTHCPTGDRLYRLAEWKMRITDVGVARDSDRENLQLQCNICKNDIGFGQPSFSCRGICDWDVCSQCVAPEIRDSH